LIRIVAKANYILLKEYKMGGLMRLKSKIKPTPLDEKRYPLEEFPSSRRALESLKENPVEKIKKFIEKTRKK
jgi:hypothetical protein